MINKHYCKIMNVFCELATTYNYCQVTACKYNKLETKCFELEQQLECVYSDPIQDLEESITELDIKNQKLEKALDKACKDVYYCTQNCSCFAFCNVCKFNGNGCERKDAECLDDPFIEEEKCIEFVKQFYLESEKQ